MDNHVNPPAAQNRAPLPLELENLSRLLRSALPLEPAESAEALPVSLQEVARLISCIVDPVTCTLLCTPFLLQLETELHRVHRGKSELALVCFDLVGADTILRQYGPHMLCLSWQSLVCTLKNTTLPCDCIGHMRSGHYALILPGAGAFKAQALTEKMLSQCAAHPLQGDTGGFCPQFLAGIASVSGEQAEASCLVQQALHALENARQKGVLCAVYRASGPASSLYQTLVHSNEKRFLFSGGK